MKFLDRMLNLLSLVVILLFVIDSSGLFDVMASAQTKNNSEVSLAEETQVVAETVAETVGETVPEIVPETTIPEETIPEFVYEEQVPMVPLYFQQDYAHVPYGGYKDSVSTNGCGITSLAMVFTYLFDEPIMPDRLAKEYRGKGSDSGSCWTLFPDSAKDYGIEGIVQTGDWKPVEEALQRGQVVIANARGNTIFTTGGHYIVLVGMTEEGRIIVRDPNRYNYNAGINSPLGEGFSYGFEPKYLKHCYQFWIYPHKDYAKLSADAEAAYYAQFN